MYRPVLHIHNVRWDIAESRVNLEVQSIKRIVFWTSIYFAKNQQGEMPPRISHLSNEARNWIRSRMLCQIYRLELRVCIHHIGMVTSNIVGPSHLLDPGVAVLPTQFRHLGFCYSPQPPQYLYLRLNKLHELICMVLNNYCTCTQFSIHRQVTIQWYGFRTELFVLSRAF